MRTGALLTTLLIGAGFFVSGPQAGFTEESEGLKLEKTSLFGGSGNQRGRGLSIYESSLYVSGVDETRNGGQALVVKYALPLTESPVWTAYWPPVVNGSGNVNSEVFDDVVGMRGGVFVAGRSWSQTEDGLGGKEHKSILAKFPLDGATGSAIGGAEWVATPNFFLYKGNETFWAAAFGYGDPSRGFYAAGSAQASGVNNTAVLAKYDLGGSLLWSRILGNTGLFMNSFATNVAELHGYTYVAGTTEYPYTSADSTQLAIWKFDNEGHVVWMNAYPLRYRLGWTVADIVATKSYQSEKGYLYVATTRKESSGSGANILILKYDENGTLLWAKSWGGLLDDVAHAIAANDHFRSSPAQQRLYVAGKTRSFGVGGWDAVLLEVDPVDGSVLSSRTHGGAADDVAWGVQVASFNGKIYVAGETKSFANAGNAVGQNDLMLLEYVSQKPPAPPLLPVRIDIKPGTSENSINPKSQGKIPVAILSDARFSAPEEVNQETLTFGHIGNERSLAFCSAEDINADGKPDLVCHFETEKAAFESGDLQGILQGLSVRGMPIMGNDAVRIAPVAR